MYNMFNTKQSARLRKTVIKQLEKGNVKGQLIEFQPVWVRVSHWGFALSLTVVLLSGLELHQPASFLALNYSKVLITHIAFCWSAMGFVAIRTSDAIIRRDRSLIPSLQGLKDIPKILAYYFFLRSSPPPSKKYNSLQQLIYFSWFLLFLIASLLGLASYWQGKHLLWVWHLVGGFQVLRWIKYSISIYFVATILVHIYLCLTEDISRLQAMITGYERNPPAK